MAADEEHRGKGIDRGQLDGMVEAVATGRMTRGELIARGTALGLSVSGIGALLAACGGGGGTTASSQPASTTAAQAGTTTAPSRGGTLRVAAGGSGQGDTLDLAKMADPVDGMRIRALYDQLFFSDAEYKPQPWLASEVEASADAKEWTIRLVEGATFHDGTPVTADDVKFTIERTLDPDVGAFSADILSFLKGADLKVMDPRTLRINLTAGYADLPSVFADPGTNIVPRTYDPATANTAPIGSGPFRFQSFTPGQESVFVRNEDYWADGYPFADELVITDIPDESARNNALLGGQVDLIVNVSYSSAAPLESGGAQIIDIPGTTILPICCVMDMEPFSNAGLREAFALSLDRDEIVSIVYQGYGRVGNDQPISDSYPFAPVDIPQRTRDLDRARQLLSEAGYPNGVEATLITGDASPGMLDLATVVAEQAKEAGFDISLKKWPADSFWNDVWLKKNFYTSAWTQKSTPELYLARTIYSDSSWNESHFRDPEVDQLLTQARESTDAALRTDLYTQAMQKVHDSASWVIAGYGDLLHAARTGFSWEQLPPPLSAPHLFNAAVEA